MADSGINRAFFHFDKPRVPYDASLRLSELEALYLLAYDESGYGPEDVRSATFAFCRQSIQANLVGMNLINAFYLGIIPEELQEKAIGPYNASITNQALNLSDYLRKSLTVSLNFYHENMLANILTSIDGKHTRGFETIIKRLAEEITLDNKKEVFDRLRVLMHIRNSFHNNGKHNNDSVEFSIAGLQFKFITGNVVDCSGWGHIYWLAYATVNSLLKIIAAPEIQKIEAPIDIMYYIPRQTPTQNAVPPTLMRPNTA
jgi:hypothetical protein